MTLYEIETLWQSRKTAMNIWHDRMFEMSQDQLIALVKQYMPMADAELILKQIDFDRHVSRQEESNES